MFEGVYTALITPFKDGNIDYSALEKIIETQISGGVDGIVPLGTTGESPTVSFAEHGAFIKKVVEIVSGRVKVVAGTGANSTTEAVDLSKSAEDVGVDGVLLVNPYYNKPTQNGMIAHFEKIAKSIDVPIILYNIPGRTGVNFLPESLNELLNRVDNIAAIKEASGDIAQMMRFIELCGDRINLLSGDDNLLLPVLSIGGKGIVSVISNLLPSDVKKIITSYNEGNFSQAKKLFYKLLPLSRTMFVETNPIPIKAAMEIAGYCEKEIRLPLLELSEQNREKLIKEMKSYGVKF